MRIGGPKSLRGQVALVFLMIGVVLSALAVAYVISFEHKAEEDRRRTALSFGGEFIQASSGLALYGSNRNAAYISDEVLDPFMRTRPSAPVEQISVHVANDGTGEIELEPLSTCRRIAPPDRKVAPCNHQAPAALPVAEIQRLAARYVEGTRSDWAGMNEVLSADQAGTDSDIIVYVRPILFRPLGEERAQYVGLAFATARQNGYVAVMRENVELIAGPVLLMLLIAGAMFLMLNRLVIGPVSRLAETASDIAESGEIGAKRIPTDRGDATEIVELVDCFNAMTAAVGETNANLNRLVEERTRALADTNADLTATVERANAYAAELADAKAGLEALNSDLVTAVERAEEASQAKSEFLARMNHEIRNPLNSIIQRAEYLQEIAEEEELDEFHEETTGIMNKSQHLLGVINQVLDMSKIESGKIEPEIHAREIILLVEEVKDMAEPMVQKNRSKLIIDAPEDTLGEMRTDVTMLRQCLLNLLSNSAKFTSQGEVTMTVRARTPVEAEARLGRQAKTAAEWISFVVSDTGIGMTPDELARVFTPFTQANETISAHYGGTGLGLALTQKFCQALGGDVFMDSVKDKGTTAEILLPRVMEGDSPEAIITKIAASSKSRRILVIEDETHFFEQIEEVLAPLKADVRHVRTADSGLAMCRSLRPDVILLDIDMPIKDGYKFLEELRAEPGFEDLPVLIVTKTEPTDQVEKLGAKGFFAKPISSDRIDGLISLVREVLSDRNPERILVVDDEDPIRRTLRRSFEAQGANVVEAENGAVALTRLSEGFIPDLVIMDLVMPEMDGFETIGRMRDNPVWRDVPIIVLTSKDLTRNERRYVMGATEGLLDKNTVPLKDVVHHVARLVEGGTHGV